MKVAQTELWCRADIRTLQRPGAGRKAGIFFQTAIKQKKYGKMSGKHNRIFTKSDLTSEHKINKILAD